MERMIRVHFALGESREVSAAEAERIIKDAYRQGWLAFDRKNHDVIAEIAPDVEEIMVLNTVVIGG